MIKVRISIKTHNTGEPLPNTVQLRDLPDTAVTHVMCCIITDYNSSNRILMQQKFNCTTKMCH